MAWLLLLIFGSVLGDFQHEVDYISALRARGLHRLAEVQCRRLLGQDQLSESDRVQANIQLSKTLAERALNSRPPQRDEYWNRSFAVISDALKSSNQPSSQLLLQLQLALSTLERAEWTRREAEVRASQDEDWQPARAQVRAAIRQLQAVEEELKQPLMRAGTAGIAATRVAELLRNTNYQLSRAYRNQAITYAKRLTDQIASLNLALAKLQPIAGETVADDLVWTSRIDRIQCFRLRGDLERVSQLIAGTVNAPERLLGRLGAEGVRLALAAKQPQAALKMLQSQSIAESHPELELARIETFVMLAMDDVDRTAKTDYQRQAAEVASRLNKVHGNYWGLRGEMLIARLADRAIQNGGGDSELLDTAAKTLLKQSSPEQATEMFISGARQAENNQEFDKAFDFRLKAATVDHQNGNLQAAIDRFLDVAFVRYPDHPKAPETHLLAVFDAAALYQEYAKRVDAGANDKLAQYDKLLRQHLARWPSSESADQARIWFGRLTEAQRKTAEAIEAYRGIRAGSEHAAEAYSRLGKLYEEQFGRDFDVGRVDEVAIAEARDWMSTRLSNEVGPVASKLNVQLARLLMLFPPRDYLAAAKLLAQSPQQPELAALSVIALAGQGNFSRAQEHLTRALPMKVEPLLLMVRGLQPLRDERPDDVGLRTLVLECVELIKPYVDQISEADRLLLRTTVTDADTADRALATYQQLAETHKTNARIQLKYAELVSLGRDRASREAALKQWRFVVQQSRPRSVAWFRGKLGVAQTHFNKGEHEKTREVIELLMTLYPEMGGSELKESFAKLLARCK